MDTVRLTYMAEFRCQTRRDKPWETSMTHLVFTAKTASANQETALHKTRGLLHSLSQIL